MLIQKYGYLGVHQNLIKIMAKKKEEQYEGEYKVGLSDQGRVKFDLNWKWLIGIAITIMGFVGYLVIDKYHNQPITELRQENADLKDALKSERLERLQDKKAIGVLTNNQGILLDRSERTQSFISDWLNKSSNTPTSNVDESALDHSNSPGTN
jgi:hypothetical protein